MSVILPKPGDQSVRNQKGKLSLWGLVASHHGIQTNFSKTRNTSGREIKSFPMLLFKHLDQQNSETSKYLCSIGQVHTLSHNLHLFLLQDNTAFETSLLAVNQVTKEYTTVHMTAAEEFLVRNKWTQGTSELHENRHETEVSSNQYN